MKEATSELANTVVVITCVAILLAFFFFVVWPVIHNNFVSQTSCDKAICEPTPDSDGMVKCVLIDEKTGSRQEFMCNYKG